MTDKSKYGDDIMEETHLHLAVLIYAMFEANAYTNWKGKMKLFLRIKAS